MQVSTTSRVFITASVLVGAASTAHAEQLVGPVNKAEWGTNIPSHIEMYVGVPDNLPENAPILVNIHSCGNSAGGQWGYAGFAPLRQAMESVGFLMIVPQQSRNCWDVGTTESLTHGGGGDTGAILQMIQYVVDTYGADPSRVYAMGGSGGGMCVQALMAVYPEIFKGGHARAGVPAGCWAESYDPGQQWSGPCAGGQVDKTPQEWGDLVRAMNPGYTGPRPRLQINQGTVDETVSFNNFREGIEQWTNVLELDEMPTDSASNVQGAESTYNTQFWDDACGYRVLEMWEAIGKGHSMGYESVDILRFFGLDQVREQDPWDEACAGMIPPEDDGMDPADDAAATDDATATDDAAADDTMATDDAVAADDTAAGADDSATDDAATTDDMAATDDTGTPEPDPSDDTGAASGGTGGAGTGTEVVPPAGGTGTPDVGVGSGTGAGGMGGVAAGGAATTTPTGTAAPSSTSGATPPAASTTTPDAQPSTGVVGVMGVDDPSMSSADSGGCSFAPTSTRATGLASLGFALGLLLTRRRRQG